VRSAAPYGAGGFAILGTRGGERGWYVPGESGYALTLPPEALPRWSDKDEVAFFRRDENRGRLHIGKAQYDVDGAGAGLAWLPGGERLLALVWKPEGSAELRSYSRDGSFKMIARGLDAPFFFTSIAASADGRSLFLALASKAAPVGKDRHDPEADRDLDLYALDLESGALSTVFEGGGDDFSPAITGGSLFWISNECLQQVVVFAIEGGAPRVVVEHGYLPGWSPDGKTLAFTVGDWRLADVPMNLDALSVEIDSEVRAVSEARGIVTGYHEDFTPVWSPDGKWLAFHSHRSPAPVSIFDEEGSSDDIYLRRADGSSPEIRLTDFGHEVGSPLWMPDSRRLLFGSQEPGTSPPVTRTWTVEIDPDSGRMVSKTEFSLPGGIRRIDALAVSPSGKEIAFLGEGEGGKAVSIQNVESGSLQKLASYSASTHGGADWTPDGTTLIYTALGEERMEVFSIRRSGGSWGQPRRIASDDADLIHPRISPDGRWVAASRVRWTKTLRSRELGEAR
jgi:Tol biopolymer transport system component